MNKLAVVAWLALLAGAPAHALDALDDAALSLLSGQDGITIGVKLPNSTLVVSEVNIRDDSIAGTHLGQSFASMAELGYAPTTYSATAGGISLCTTGTGACTAESSPVSLVMDAAGPGPATLNMALNLPTTTRRLLVNPFSLYMSPNTSIFNATRTALSANVDEILKVSGAEGLSILLAAPTAGTPALTFNLQLGKQSQGAMLTISNGKLLRIGNDPSGANPIQVLSKNSLGSSSLKLNVDLCSFDAVTAATGACNTAYSGTGGFSLAGFYADISSSGVIFGNSGTTDKFNILFDNALAGTSGSQVSTTFDGLKNGPMGSVGLVGVQVTNLQIQSHGL